MKPRKYLIFRLRMIALYPFGLAAIAYVRWLAPRFGRAHAQRIGHAAPRWAGKAVLALNGISLRVEGRHHLDGMAEGPLLLLSNHTSRFDGYIMLALMPRRFKSFWSTEAHVNSEDLSVANAFGRAFDLFFVHAKNDRRATLAEFKAAERHVREGGALSFFPEGKFSQDGWVRDIGTSCVSMGIRTGAPIVPVVVHDACEAFERRQGGQGGGPQEILVTILPALPTIGRAKSEVAAVVRHLETSMNATLAAGGKASPPPVCATDGDAVVSG